MAFMYEGVNVDVVAPGYPSTSAAATRANNIITIATRKLAEIDGIVASYQAAYTPYAAALAYAKTLDPKSKDPSVRSAIIAAQIQISKLHPELAKWGKIVVANGGKFASGTVGNTGSSEDATPDFTAKRKKYNDDIAKYHKDLVKNGGLTPFICAPYDAAYAAMLNQARADNDAALAASTSVANTQVAYLDGIASLSNPNQSSTDPGYAQKNSKESVTALLQQGASSGALVWDLNTLKAAASTTANGKSLTNQELLAIGKGLSKGASLTEVTSRLESAGRNSKSKVVVAKSAPAKRAPAAKPAAKPAPAPKPKPPKPKGRA